MTYQVTWLQARRPRRAISPHKPMVTEQTRLIKLKMSDLPVKTESTPPLSAVDRIRAVMGYRGRRSPPFMAPRAIPALPALTLLKTSAQSDFGFAAVAAPQAQKAQSLKSNVALSPRVNSELNTELNVKVATRGITPDQMLVKPLAPTSAEEAKVLKSLELTELAHAILCVPTSYVDCRFPVTSLAGYNDGFRGLFWLKKTGRLVALDNRKKEVSSGNYDSILDAPFQGFWSRIKQIQVEMVDEDGLTIWQTLFNPWKLRKLNPLGSVLVEGELMSFGYKQFLVSASDPPADVAGKVWPRFVLPGAPAEAVLRSVVNKALQVLGGFDIAAHLLVTTTLLSEQQLLAIAEAGCGMQYESLVHFLQSLHAPESPIDGDLAASAARFMATAGVCAAARSASVRLPHAKTALNIIPAVLDALIGTVPEKLTADQLKVILELAVALRRPTALNGLISGDVGTGKTLAFILPAVAAHLAGAQVSIISPTEILANQVAANLAHRFPQARVERVFAGKKIIDVGAILIGTSGLASVARKQAYVPNFLVIDEQHKLATKDRDAMVGPWTHKLEASATPIPRSLAATLYSGIQVLTLSSSPVQRQIESFVLDESERSKPGNWMLETLAQKGRVAIIYPRVEKSKSVLAKPMKRDTADSEGSDMDIGMNTDLANSEPPMPSKPSGGPDNVQAAAKSLEQRFPGQVGMLHGKMTTEELTGTLNKFRSGELPLVVASTIMETGIDVPDIRLLIVKDADNFGAAQLHQLRGRLARNGGAARFVMMVTDKSLLPGETAQRLNTVQSITDGYALAEADMQSRGFGDLAGTNQSGNSSCAFRLLALTLADFA